MAGLWRWLGCVGIAGGCVGRPLDEVPVRGGTAQARAIARDELARFDRWVGPGRVQLREVRILDAEPGTAGEYHRGGHRIDLDGAYVDGQPGVERYALRHELCHALDLQEGLLADATAPFDALVTTADPSAFSPSLEARGRRSEVMAYLCSPGPWATIGMSRSCPGDAGEVDRIGRWFADNVWLGDPELDPAAGADDAPAATLRAPFPIEGLHLGGFTDGSLLVGLFGAADAVGVRVEPWTGRELDGDSAVASVSAAEWAAWPAGLGPDDPLTTATLRAGEGDVAAVWAAQPDWIRLELAVAPRVFAVEDGRWRTVDRCTGPIAALAATPDDVWVGWARDRDAAWEAVR